MRIGERDLTKEKEITTQKNDKDNLHLKKININEIADKIHKTNKLNTTNKKLNIQSSLSSLKKKSKKRSKKKEIEQDVSSEELKTIIPAIKTLKKNKIRIYGPISGDTAFNNQSKTKYDVIILVVRARKK